MIDENSSISGVDVRKDQTTCDVYIPGETITTIIVTAEKRTRFEKIHSVLEWILDTHASLRRECFQTTTTLLVISFFTCDCGFCSQIIRAMILILVFVTAYDRACNLYLSGKKLPPVLLRVRNMDVVDGYTKSQVERRQLHVADTYTML